MLLSDELRKVLKEYVAKADFDGLHNHLILRGPKSKNIIEQEEIQFKKKKAIIESLKKIQPSFDKISSIPERDI